MPAHGARMSRYGAVPYVTAYDGEDVAYQLVMAQDREATDGVRLSYLDATKHDSLFGVLWHRHGTTRVGDPLWKLVNTARQRRCMLHTLCQVCGKTAVDYPGTDRQRISWVMPELPGRAPGGQPFTNTPPTCRSCIRRARRVCPRLRKESYVYTAQAWEPYGVVAEIFRPAGRGVIEVDQAVELPLDAFHDLEYALAKQLLVTLDGLQPAHLDDNDLCAAT